MQVEYRPRWFTRADPSKASNPFNPTGEPVDTVWQYGGDYWAAREKGAWGDSPDIYSADQCEKEESGSSPPAPRWSRYYVW